MWQDHTREGGECKQTLGIEVVAACHTEINQDSCDVRQTNGVGQGSPDSPVLFATAVGESMNSVLEGQPARVVTLRRKTEKEVSQRVDGGPHFPYNGGGVSRRRLHLGAFQITLTTSSAREEGSLQQRSGNSPGEDKILYVYIDEGDEKLKSKGCVKAPLQCWKPPFRGRPGGRGDRGTGQEGLLKFEGAWWRKIQRRQQVSVEQELA